MDPIMHEYISRNKDICTKMVRYISSKQDIMCTRIVPDGSAMDSIMDTFLGNKMLVQDSEAGIFWKGVC